MTLRIKELNGGKREHCADCSRYSPIVALSNPEGPSMGKCLRHYYFGTRDNMRVLHWNWCTSFRKGNHVTD